LGKTIQELPTSRRCGFRLVEFGLAKGAMISAKSVWAEMLQNTVEDFLQQGIISVPAILFY